MTAQQVRQAFQDALAKDRCDQTTRLVFADWLEEHGFDDDAVEQRRCTTDEWVRAARWLEDFAKRCGKTCVNYHEVWQNSDAQWERGVPSGEIVKVEMVWEEITFDVVVKAGVDFLDKEDYFVQQGSEQARGLLTDLESRKRFWENWQVVTGRLVEEETAANGQPFSCTC